MRGETLYFGKVADDPDGKAAIEKWLNEKDDRLAGRVPRARREGLTVKELVNQFLAAKEARVESKEITKRYFDELFTTCETIIKQFGKNRLVTDLAAEDFEALRAARAKTWRGTALANAIGKIRGVFKFAYDEALIDSPIRFGAGFRRPNKAVLRRERAEKGERLFEPGDLRSIIDAAGIPLKAMVLLGINCGLGNSDCGRLKQRNVDLVGGWLTYPRPKTGIARRSKLWPETVAAIRNAIDKRPAPKSKADAELAFVTIFGARFTQDRAANSVSQEFRNLLRSLELHRPGFSFYTLRHQFETIAGETRDQVAVDYAMGHADPSMGAQYRERIGDDRLAAIADHVHAWLWPKTTEKATAPKSKPKATAKPKRKRKATPQSKSRPEVDDAGPVLLRMFG